MYIQMWDNSLWATGHLKRRHPDVSVEEAWEVVFEMGGKALVSPDQYRYPPYRRYWMIGETLSGRKLLVVWEQWRHIRNLITAYAPDSEKVRLYEEKIKKQGR